MIQRRGFLFAGAALLIPSLYHEMFVLDDPPVDAVLRHPLSELTLLVTDWARRVPSPQPPDVTVALLRLSTACHDFAQSIAIHLNARSGDIPTARRGLDNLVSALRHALAIAERVDPTWRASIETAALDAPYVQQWISSQPVMEGAFYLFQRFASRFEVAARRLAAETA